VSYRTFSIRAVELINSTIGTYQTLNNVERLKKFDPSKFKLVIVDEAHHAAAFS
jgi:ATP-dependent helicase IRC3